MPERDVPKDNQKTAEKADTAQTKPVDPKLEDLEATEKEAKKVQGGRMLF